MDEIDYDATIKQLLANLLKNRDPVAKQHMAATIEHLERARQVRMFGGMAMMHHQLRMTGAPS